MPTGKLPGKKKKSSYNTQLKNLDKRVLWHPFTQMKEWAASDPLVIGRAEGVWLYDTEGGYYLDGTSSLWVTVHGHRRPEIDRAVKDQIDQVAHSTMLGLTHEPAVELGKRLTELAPEGLTRVFYSDSGSEAVEIALKMAFQFWRQREPSAPRKTKFLALQNAYHGDTIGAVSVGGIDLFHKIYKPLLFEAVFTPSPYCYRCPVKHEKDVCCKEPLAEIERTIVRYKSDLAAIIVEPVMQAAAGMIPQPPGFLKRVEELCREHNILLIADCVAVGFGRTGKMFACEHEDIHPDLMAVAKGLTGGYLPLAATLATEEVFEAFLGDPAEARTFFHGHTYTGNPLACRAAIANLDIFVKEKTLERMQAKIRLLTEHLSRFNELGHVGDVRQRGFMVGIELVKDKRTKAPYLAQDQIGAKVVAQARQRGVIIRPLGNVIVLMPPLSIKTSEMDFLCNVVYEAVQAATRT